MYAIGLVELAGRLALLSRRAAAPAALLLMAVMVGAIASHLRVGDPVSTAAPAAVPLILLGAVAWRRRST